MEDVPKTKDPCGGNEANAKAQKHLLQLGFGFARRLA
jgi:hypothetical protein